MKKDIESLGLDAVQKEQFLSNIDQAFIDHETEVLAVYEGETPSYIAIGAEEKEFLFSYIKSHLNAFTTEGSVIPVDVIEQMEAELKTCERYAESGIQPYDGSSLEFKPLTIGDQVKAYTFPVRLFHILSHYANFKMTGTTKQETFESDFGRNNVASSDAANDYDEFGFKE